MNPFQIPKLDYGQTRSLVSTPTQGWSQIGVELVGTVGNCMEFEIPGFRRTPPLMYRRSPRLTHDENL